MGIRQTQILERAVDYQQLAIGQHVPSNFTVNADGTSDYKDIQSAIDALPSTGGKIFIKAGTYEIDSTLTIPSNTSLEGVGYSSHIKLADGTNDPLIENDDQAGGNNYMDISNLRIDGNYANNTSSFNYGIYFRNVDNSRIEHVWVHDCSKNGAGIFFDSCEYNILSSLHSYDHALASSGIYLTTSSNYNILDGCQSYNNGGWGVRVVGSDYNVISDCTLDYNDYSGIRLNNGDFYTINGNIIRRNKRHGIELYDRSDHNVCNGNIVVNNSRDNANTYSGIAITSNIGYSTYNTITNNQCIDTTNTQKYGIEEDNAGDDYNQISGNTCRGNVTAPINSLGPHSMVFNNIEK